MTRILKCCIVFGIVVYGAGASAQEFTEGCDKREKISIVGLDKNKKPTVIKVSTCEYIKQLRGTVNAFHESTQLVLAKRKAKVGWMLRTFVAGIGLDFEAGLGPIINVTAAPRIKLVFGNKKDPLIP